MASKLVWPIEEADHTDKTLLGGKGAGLARMTQAGLPVPAESATVGAVDRLFSRVGAADDLARAEIPSQWHLSFGVGHGIDAGGLRHGGLFLAKGFGIRAR